MTEKLSNAAQERAAAQRALKNGGFADRETYTAKQVAMRCGTDAKTMRKFFRSTHSTVEPVGQGGRYEFDAKDFPKIKKEFDGWTKRSALNTQARTTPAPRKKVTGPIVIDPRTVPIPPPDKRPDDRYGPDDDFVLAIMKDEPSDEELAELEDEFEYELSPEELAELEDES